MFSHANLANAITSGSIVASAGALLLAGQGALPAALSVGALALLCDVLDGMVARRLKASSEFGAELDSLCDAIAFGAVPAVLGYLLGLRGPAASVLVVYTLAAVWRLARFNLVKLASDSQGRECFEGVPTTFVAAVFYVVASVSLWLPNHVANALLVVFFVTAAITMNTAFSFPKRGLHTRVLWVLVPAALLFSVVHR